MMAVAFCPYRKVRDRVWAMLSGISLYMSFALLALSAVLRFIIGRRVHFHVTGSEFSGEGPFEANGAGTKVVEVIVGAGIVGLAAWSGDCLLAGIGLALLMAPIYVVASWNRPLTRLAVAIPALLVIAGIMLSIGGGPHVNGSLACLLGMATLLFS